MISVRSTLLAALTVAGLSACTEEPDGAPHPVDHLVYPIDVQADPSGRYVWVTSGNFNYAYRSAAVLAYDVVENRFVPELAFESGPFPGPLSFYAPEGKVIAAYIPSREEKSLYYVTFSGEAGSDLSIACPGGVREAEGEPLRCPKSGALKENTIRVDGETFEFDLGEAPYATAVRVSQSPSEPDLLFVGDMEDGILSTLSLDPETGTPELIGNLTVFQGLYGLKAHTQTGRLYVSGKYASGIAVYDVKAREEADKPGSLDPENPFLTRVASVSIPEPASTLDRARAIAVSKDGKRLYVTHRSPDSLVVIDLSETSEGKPSHRVVRKVATCDNPIDVVVHTPSSDPYQQELVYVSCYNDHRIEVIDPNAGIVLASVNTGPNPSGMAVIDSPDLGIERLFVALFDGKAMGLVELDPTSPYYHQEIAEIR